MITYQTLSEKLNFNKDLPFTPDWSAAADFLNIISDHCLTLKPEIIVECSCGLSTLILARCCQLNGIGHVYSLENGPDYAARTRQQLEQFNLTQYASVIDAPLEKITLHKTDYLWYSTHELPDETIDMLVIDGPPGFMQKNSRYPALPLLTKRLSRHCVVFLDDAARDDEQNIIRQWLKDYPQLTHQYISAERGCSILTAGT
ncbi:MAG: class I SAM-dependent methyltransferase [Gammaproteobacteria bacterium]|nr:class I SAM-dependent methyltransferase [Gammaproteobacteria bacterium]MDH5734857.1 class I SAM-dependent methyltransferase [Gammaproteobacteria bacterium]